MTLLIPAEQVNEEVRDDFINERIKNVGIDFQYNGIYGNIGDKEVCVFSFEKYFKADNRYTTYQIEYDSTFILIYWE